MVVVVVLVIVVVVVVVVVVGLLICVLEYSNRDNKMHELQENTD